MKTLILTALLLSTSFLTASRANTPPTTTQIAQADENILTPQQVQQTAKNITVRIKSANNGGSGVIIAQKGSNYLILTNAHVVKRATNIEIQAPDGQKYRATSIDGGFDSKYDLALLQFTSKTKYTLANLASIAGSPIEPERTIYSAGFPFDSQKIRITKGQVSQLTDIPFNDGTQLGYITDKGEKGIRQGMSGGAIFDAQGNLLGINTVGVAPILPDYTYNDGSKPTAKLKAQYRQANWGIPIYNFLTNVKPDILYGYANLPKVERQVTPTGFMARLNIKARQMTVRIENSGGNGSGVIVARDASGYYVLTAKHVVQDYQSQAKFTNHQIITYDQDRHGVTGTVVAEGVDLAVMKFTSNNVYPLARMGEYSPNQDDLAFVGGFPGRTNINSPLWQWQLNPGFINDREQGKLQAQTNQSFSNGYDLIYSSISYGGMSGGPIFDTAGNVIGIHGRTESTDLNSLGISIQTFTGLLVKLRVDPKLVKIVSKNPVDLSSVDRNNVILAIKNIPEPQAGDDGNRWLAYGNQLYRTKQFNKSVTSFDRAISKGQVLLGNYEKALALRNIGEYKLAKIAIAKAIFVIPPNQRAKYYYFWKYQSLILKDSGKYDEAIAAINMAIGFNSDDISLLNEKGGILSQKKQYAQEISLYDEIIRRSPESYAYLNRGNAKSQIGNKQAAIIDYDRAIFFSPNSSVAYNNRGVSKYHLGSRQEAVTDFNRAISLDNKSYMAYNNRGLALFEGGDSQKAIIDYDRAIMLNPKYMMSFYNRGLAKSQTGNKQAAIIDYNRAIALDPQYAEAYNNRGLDKSSMGNKQGAIEDLDRAIALNPNSATYYGNRALDKLELGDRQGAINDMSQAAKLFQKQGQIDLSQKARRSLEKMKR
jgi:tetratricopeptide (TPR) repeat protein/S1-C subfamily serine protease